MHTAGIIAEYNPFHKGHSYQIREIRKRTGADYVVVAMSGDFVQRGEPALADKYVRAQMALAGGADLVLELPVVFATASAERFARGGVSLLAGTGVVDVLCFGAEADASALPLLQEVGRLVEEEPERYHRTLCEELSRGSSFPTARSRAVLAALPSESLSSFLSLPNNILAIEYLRALAPYPRIAPVLIPRKGDGHLAVSPSSAYASASAIRRLLLDGEWQAAAGHLPDSSLTLLQDYRSSCPLLSADALSPLLGYRLLSLKYGQSDSPPHQSADTPGTPSPYEAFADCNRPLARRIERFLPQYREFSQFCSLLKTKALTHARIRRALLHILLDIKPQEDLTVPYLRVLGFRKSARPLLAEIKKRGSLPLLTKMADASRSLSPEGRALLEKDLCAADLYMQLVRSRTGADTPNEFTHGIIIL